LHRTEPNVYGPLGDDAKPTGCETEASVDRLKTQHPRYYIHMAKRSEWFILLVATWTATATDLRAQAHSATSQEETVLRELFDRWERVWHEGQYDLVAQCVQPNYIRHEQAGDRTVTREAYGAEIAKTRKELPHLRFVVYDHAFEGNRAWFRYTFKWTDPKTGEARTRAGVQIYRVEAGKLAETWVILLGMDGCGRAGALDEPVANQVRLLALHNPPFVRHAGSIQRPVF
jgi:hypothetical protein